MAFTVPNRPDGVAQDQAEPDKGDFQTLGYQKSGVLTGGATTRSAANTVTVAAITGYLNGEYFSVSSDTVLNFAAPPSGNAKFVLILVQKSGSTFSVYAEQGTAGNSGQSATNAMFPNDVDYTAKMLIASVYYASGDTDISASSIVDKRVFVLPQANPTAVASSPGATDGTIGEIRIDSSLASPSNATGQSNVWIKTTAATWTNLGEYSLTSDGTDGAAATITIGTVTTGTPLAVSNRGTSTAAILDFTIPSGETGGGLTGAAGTISVDPAVTTLAAGSSASVAVSGTPQARHLAFSIPRGASGSDSGYNWSLYTSGNPSPAAQVAAYEHVSFHGAGGIAVRNTGRTVTIDGSNVAASTYSFKMHAGGLNALGQATISNNDVVQIVGGTDMVVTQSGSNNPVFTINYVGTTSAEYISSTKTGDQSLSGLLLTEHLVPASSGVYGLGNAYLKYHSAVFSNSVWALSHISTSDRSLKQSFGASPGLDFLNALGPLSFEFKDAPGEVRWGLVAQDVETVCGAQGISAAVVADQPETGTKYLNYMEFTAPIIKAIQELTERLEALENG